MNTTKYMSFKETLALERILWCSNTC